MPQREPQTTDLPYLVIEYPDLGEVCEEVRDDWGTVVGYTASAAILGEDFAAALQPLLDNPDLCTCAFNNMTDEASGELCTNPVGWVLHEPMDYGDRGGLEWRYTVLVRTPAGIAVVCEDDEPVNLYTNAAENARKVAP